MLKKLRSKKGFTLTELIIVIAILGILAAVLVPSMMSVVGDANQSVANSSAATVFQTAQSAFTKIVYVDGKTISTASKTYTYTGSDKKWKVGASEVDAKDNGTAEELFVKLISDAVGTSVKSGDTIVVEISTTAVTKVTYTRAGKNGVYPQS